MKKDRSKYSSSSGKVFGLPKTDILRGRNNFKRLFERSATVLSQDLISLRCRLPVRPNDDCKMAFIAAKRLGKATQRNHAKRILREAYRLNRRDFMKAFKTAGVGFHGALIAKSIYIDFKSAEQSVIRILQRVVQDLHSSFDV